jgi:hypothetical protein
MAGGHDWRKNFEAVTRAIFSGVLLVVCLYVTFFGEFPESSIKYATGLMGLILGYYLK